MMEKLASSHRVQRMCHAFEVSRSGYYKYLSRGKNGKRNKENIILLTHLLNIWLQSRRVYGSPRITVALRNMGYRVNQKRIIRLMHINGIKAFRKKKYRTATDSKHNKPAAENLLMRNFRTENPNKIWLGDITYIRTKEGFLYLAVVMDMFSRMPVGYNMQNHSRTPLVVDAFRKAIETRGIPNKLIFHSDQGTQYASDEFKQILSDYGVIQSMSRKGNCYDNAPMESFFHTLKTELSSFGRFNTRKQAEYEVKNYIDNFYIRSRLHSSLNYKSPLEFELSYSMA
jgi:transposase InsO family protein